MGVRPRDGGGRQGNLRGARRRLRSRDVGETVTGSGERVSGLVSRPSGVLGAWAAAAAGPARPRGGACGTQRGAWAAVPPGVPQPRLTATLTWQPPSPRFAVGAWRSPRPMCGAATDEGSCPPLWPAAGAQEGTGTHSHRLLCARADSGAPRSLAPSEGKATPSPASTACRPRTRYLHTYA